MGAYKRLVVLVLVTIGACLFVGHLSRAEPQEVVAAVARDFYPEYVIDADGHPGGSSTDLMNAVAKRAQLSVTYRVFEAWADLIAALERGDADVVPVVSITQARKGRMLFTRPMVTSPSSLFVRRENDDVRDWTDLAGSRVGVIAGGVSEEILSEREKSARLVPYARLQDALFGLLAGEVDAITSFQSSVWKVSERARLADHIKVVGDPLVAAQRAIAVRRDHPDLRDRLDAAAADFLQSSEYREFYSKWYAAGPSFWKPARIGWLAGASTTLLLLGMLIWQSLLLRAEDRQLAQSAPGKLPGERAAAALPTLVISQVCGLIALVLGLSVLFGWAFDIAALKTVLPGLFAMQPWAAITITLAGGALLLATVPGQIAAAACSALAVAVLIIGLQTLLQYTTEFDFGTDRWFFPEAVSNQPDHPHQGRVAEVTSIAFILLGMTLLLAPVRSAWARGMFSAIGTVGLLLMAAPLLGYLIGAGILKSVAFFTPIALHAAVGLVVLFLGVLALRPDTGWMALLSGDTPGATSIRMLLPFVVAGPVLLAWLFNSGREAGLYGTDFQLGLATLATTLLLGTALLWNAARLDRLHRARLAAAEALRESEARYRTVGEAIPYGVWVCNAEGGVEYVSQSFLDLIGKTPEEVKPRGWLDRLPPEDLRSTRDAWRACVHTGADWTWEHRVKGKDGVWRTILSLGRPVRDAQGRITSWGGFNLDISERKRAEEALRESEARLRRTVEHAPFPIMVHAENGEIMHLSQAWLDLTGYAREEIGTIAAWTERAYGERKEVRADINRLYALGRAVDEGEYLIRTADGRMRNWAFSSAPLGSDDRGRRLVVSMAADVTERKKAEQALHESEIRMRALLDASQDEILLISTKGVALAVTKPPSGD